MSEANIHQFKCVDFQTPTSGVVKVSSPSNIALVKYWGKKGEQIPANPSISFTLNNCATTTELHYEPSKRFSFQIFLDGKEEKGFEPKIEKFIQRILPYCPYLNELKFEIHTSNSFPHSSGIASSASGMSALAYGIIAIEERLSIDRHTQEFYNQKASFLARLGSGSAARSIFGPMASWGEHPDYKGSTDLFATPFDEVHEVFKTYQDTVLLVDKGQKQVSSTVGHNLMNGHPYAEARYKQAMDNMSKLKVVLQNGDLKEFNKIVESEALTLHAMMMASDPYFILMRPNTLAIIEKIWIYREQHNLNLTVTLDAGANVHLLYPEAETNKAMWLIQNELATFCQENTYICDKVGVGSTEIKA